ncbi:hypothetical protein SAMN05518846_1091, partial [Brevibacillus centrosporus]
MRYDENRKKVMKSELYQGFYDKTIT